MNKIVFEKINLTCLFQDSHSNPLTVQGEEQANPSRTVVSGMLSPCHEGGILFQETLPRRRNIRNNRLYEGELVNIVRRKDGLYYPFMKAFHPNEITDKASFAFKVYQEITEALDSID